MKKINPTASNRETEAMIRYALDHTEQLTPQERQRVHDYLSQKVVDGLPFEPEEQALMQKMPEFRPDKDLGDVWMGDYVSREELARAEYGYNIYDEGETIRALCRYLDAGEKIGKREADMIRRLHNLDVHDVAAVRARLTTWKDKQQGDTA